MRDSVVSDSSFYIAFLSPDEINDPETLTEILQKYEFFLGKVVLNEIKEKHSDLLELIGFEGVRKHLRKIQLLSSSQYYRGQAI